METRPTGPDQPRGGDDELISVLHVDDDPDFSPVVEAHLERESDRIDVETAVNGQQALDRVADGDVDCVVSDYDMPAMDGLTILERIRSSGDQVPFVLFTGKGSEEIASRAVSAGATDYIQKGGGSEQYELLANRIENAVDTARARAEAEGSRQRLRSITEALPDVGFYIDGDGRVLEAFAGPERSLVVDDEEALVGKRFHDILPREKADRFLGVVERTIATGEVQSVEFELEGPGDSRWFEARTAPLESIPGDEEGVVWVARDITDRRRNEETIAYERDRLAALFRTVPEPLVHIEFHDGRPVVRRVNDAFDQTFGFVGQDVTGRSLNDLIVPDRLMDDARDLDQQARVAGGIEREVRRRAADGERVFRFAAAPVVQRDEQVEWVATYVDVTDERRRREEVERQGERLQEFAGFVSHDLQSPLTVAQGSLELARADCDSEYLDDVAAAHDRMATLIEDLVRLVEEGERVTEMEPVDLDSIARATWRTSDTGEATLTVSTEATIRADPGRLERVLANIFRNAVRHGTADDEDGTDLTVTVTDLEDGSGFAVTDDGTGIPPERREAVFETGHSTAADGSGVGLAIVRQIAAAHGWSVDVSESDAGGTRFEVREVEVAEAA